MKRFGTLFLIAFYTLLFACHNVTSESFAPAPPPANSQGGGGGGSCPVSQEIFIYTGSDQTVTVPAGCTHMIVKAWGAGGAGAIGTYGGSTQYAGGAGGFAAGTIAVTAGQVYTVIVGQGGGALVTNSGYGGGGAGGKDSYWGSGDGGGRSAIRLAGTELITAGGGGGGGTSAVQARTGGAGGGAGGFPGGGDGVAGGGGTQSAGGASTLAGNICTGVTGSQFQGANYFCSSYDYGGGGGGGYYGGGSGGAANFDVTSGGGGSSYIGGVLIGTTIAGYGTTPGNNTDSDYVAGIGAGGAASTNGGNGLVVISWSTTLSAAPSYRYWRYQTVDNVGTNGSGNSISEIKLFYGSAWTSLVGKTITSLGGAFDGSYPMSRINDGITETNNATNIGYVAVNVGIMDFYVDLGAANAVTGVQIAPQGDQGVVAYNTPNGFIIYGSNDASTWISLYSSGGISPNYPNWNPGTYRGWTW